MLENISEIEKSLGLEEGKLSEMISSEEKHTIDLSPLLIEPKVVYEERVKNIKTEAAKMAEEVSVKKIRSEFGLEFQGKNTDNLIDAFKTHIESVKGDGGKEPEERYVSLKTDFEKLQNNFKDKENEFTAFKTNIEKEKQVADIRNEFTKHIPDNVLVSKTTIFTEAKERGYSFEKEDGVLVIKNSSGEILKDPNTLSPVGYESWVKEFSTPYLKPADGGSGKKDDVPPGKAGSFEAFEKEAEKEGWDASKKNSEMMKRIADKTLKL